VKFGVFFAVRTAFLNAIYMRFCFTNWRVKKGVERSRHANVTRLLVVNKGDVLFQDIMEESMTLLQQAAEILKTEDDMAQLLQDKLVNLSKELECN
jgi:hypothetical protein